jgi:FkbM family methyltransferase
VNAPAQPPFRLRAAAALLRAVPPARGRWRLERWLDRRVAGRHWQREMTVNDCRMDLALDDEIDRQIFLNGVYERAATAALQRLPLSGATVLDAGANVGYHTLLLAQCAGDRGRVHAFEPAPANLERLKRNLALNPHLAARVTLWPVALADAPGELEMVFAGPTHSGISHVVPAQAIHDSTRAQAGETARLKVPATTLDDWWERLGRPGIDLLKLDLEGFELRALNGARQLLAARPPAFVLVEVVDAFLRSNGGSAAALFENLRRAGYHSYDYCERRRAFVPDDTPRDTPLAIFSQSAL